MNPVESLRMTPGEITAKRLLKAAWRRVIDIPHRISWDLNSGYSHKNKENIRKFKDTHQKQRCVIIGNGPSLKNMDLSLLKDEFTFGMNRIYLLFDQISFEPTYFVSINELVLNQFSAEISELTMPKFINWNTRKKFDRDDETIIFLKDTFNLTDAFSTELSKRIFSGGTVTFVALQLAFYMGFEEVYLIGIDHNFSQKGVPNTVELRKATEDADHFHPQYFPAGSKWQLPDLLRSELAYSSARQYYEANGRKIIDATVDGKCNIFIKGDYYSIFSGNGDQTVHE